jgi:hypothetical protein
MTKIPKSITVTVRAGDGGRLTVNDSGAWDTWVERMFGRCPKAPYRLTYSLSSQGKYIVAKEGEGAIPSIELVNKHEGYYIPACFLPMSWTGKRVSRKVEKIAGKRPKEGKK